MDDKDKEGPGYRNEEWQMALELGEEEKKAAILENIEEWKLPKKLAQGVLEAEEKQRNKCDTEAACREV